MAGKMRVTQHCGRVRKGGQPFSPCHNDRNFDVSRADNIHPDKMHFNRYWSVGSGGWYGEAAKEQKPTFEEAEAGFYKEHFTEMYEASVERSRKRGQMKRVRPFDEWRKARQFVPEECHIQIGKMGKTVQPQVFEACMLDYLKEMNAWNQANGSPFTILSLGLHHDEEVPHLQIRRVWHSINPETGIDEIGQAKALERAGVALPDALKPVSTENNRKMTFDAHMREAWITVCRRHGLDIESTPEPGRKHNQTKQEYIDQKQREKAAELAAREAEIEKQQEALKAAIPGLVRDAMRQEREAAKAAKRRPSLFNVEAEAIREAEKRAEDVEQSGQRTGPGYSF